MRHNIFERVSRGQAGIGVLIAALIIIIVTLLIRIYLIETGNEKKKHLIEAVNFAAEHNIKAMSELALKANKLNKEQLVTQNIADAHEPETTPNTAVSGGLAMSRPQLTMLSLGE